MPPSPADPPDLAAMAALLDGEPPASMALLGQDAVDALAAMIRTAEQEQVAAISAAIDNALRIVPRPLRGVVKRVITG